MRVFFWTLVIYLGMSAVSVVADEMLLVVPPDTMLETPETTSVKSNIDKPLSPEQVTARIPVQRLGVNVTQQRIEAKLADLDAEGLEIRLQNMERRLGSMERESRSQKEKIRYLERQVSDLKRRR